MEGGSILSTITGKLEDARDAAALSAATLAEKTTMQSMMIPDSVIGWYQTERAALGFGPPSTPTQFAIFLFIMGAIMSYCIRYVMYICMYLFSILTRGTFGMGRGMTTFQWIVFLGLVLVILYTVFKYLVIPYLDGFQNVPSAEGFQVTPPATSPSKTAPPSSLTLLNVQPLAVKQIGYVGPKEDGGSFDTVNASGIISALKTGVRFFVFQIDFLTRVNSKSKFDPINTPTLIYRNNSGKLVSQNGLSISSAAENLASYAFNQSINSSSEPLILYLHFVNTPNALTDPTGYLEFLSKVAVALGPLGSYMTNTTPEGSFQRQQYEAILLRSPLSTFNKKVIIMTNADTTLFRNKSVKQYELSADLDYMSNVRVYLENSSDKLGITETKSGAPPHAIVVSYERLAAMSSSDKMNFAKGGRERFVIAMPPQIGNPSVADIRGALDTLGVNVLPLNMFGESYDSIKSKVSVWNGEPLQKLKPVMLLSQNPNILGAERSP
jgi:hypothetical protein